MEIKKPFLIKKDGVYRQIPEVSDCAGSLHRLLDLPRFTKKERLRLAKYVEAHGLSEYSIFNWGCYYAKQR